MLQQLSLSKFFKRCNVHCSPWKSLPQTSQTVPPYWLQLINCSKLLSRPYIVTGSNFQSWSTSKYLTVGTTLHIIDMTKLHPSCIIKVTWFSVDIISPLLNAFFLHIIVVLTATGYPLHLLKYLLLEKDPVTSHISNIVLQQSVWKIYSRVDLSHHWTYTGSRPIWGTEWQQHLPLFDSLSQLHSVKSGIKNTNRSSCRNHWFFTSF